MTQTFLLSLLLVWLLVCMIYDLRYREVPYQLTLYPMLVAGVYGLLHGFWMPVLLVILLIFISDVEPRSRRLLLGLVATVFAGVFDEQTVPLVLAVSMIWLLWEMGAMGGADAKLLMTIPLVIGSPWVLVWIAFTGGVQGVFGLLLRKRSLPYIVAIFAGTLSYAGYGWWNQLI